MWHGCRVHEPTATVVTCTRLHQAAPASSVSFPASGLTELQNKQSKTWFSICIERQRQADLLILRPAWSALQVPGEPGLHSVPLSRKAEGYVCVRACAERWMSSSEHSLFLEDPHGGSQPSIIPVLPRFDVFMGTTWM